MPVSWAEIIGSRTIKFIVGKNVDRQATEFDVYEMAIAGLSNALPDTFRKGWPREREVVWPDVGKQTFERFYQFAVTGDYSIPELQLRKEEKPASENEGTHVEIYMSTPEQAEQEQVEEPPVEEPYPQDSVSPAPISEPEAVDGWDVWGKSYPQKKSKKGSKKIRIMPEAVQVEEPHQEEVQPEDSVPQATWATSFAQTKQNKISKKKSACEALEALSYPLLSPRTNFLDTCEPSEVFLKTHSYSNVLLSHVNLYLLADIYKVKELKNLTLYKLHKTLLNFQLDNGSIGDIINLVNSVYGLAHAGGGIGVLRDLVCHFLVAHTVTLTDDERFMNLLENGGDFAKDLWKYEVRRNHW